MSASPAQIANDMTAQAKYWCGRDMDIELACDAAGRVIRAFLEGKKPHGNAIRGALGRIDRLLQPSRGLAGQQIWTSLTRAQAAIWQLRNAAEACP